MEPCTMYFDDGRFYVTTLHFGSFHMLSKKFHIVNHKKNDLQIKIQKRFCSSEGAYLIRSMIPILQIFYSTHKIPNQFQKPIKENLREQ